MTAMKDRRYGPKSVVAAFVGCVLALAGCAGEEDIPAFEPERSDVSEVPVVISFGTTWQQDDVTRVPPPGQETTVEVDGWDETSADKVRLVVFRRKDMDDQLQGGVNDAPFTYDPTNDYTLDCTRDEDTKTITAQGSIRKIYGYEYRVVGIAYDSKRANAVRSGNTFVDGEQNLFTLNVEDGTTFDDFKATVKTGDIWSYIYDMDVNIIEDVTTTNFDECLTRKMAFVPEFFYGYCTTASGNEIIKFAEQKADGSYDKAVALTGVLYRGVAKVQVELVLEPYEYHAISRDIYHAALLATNVNTVTGLSSYDDFLTPSSPVPDYVVDGVLGYTGSYTVIDYRDAENGKVTFTAFVLPAKMKLGVRFLTRKEVALTTHFGLFNGEIHVADKTYNDGEGATGVISPDAHNNEFYFRRNHKYVLRGTSSSILSHQLD